MLAPMFRLNVTILFFDRGEDGDTKAAGEESPPVLMRISPYVGECRGIGFGSVVNSFEVSNHIGLSGIAVCFLVSSMAFGDRVCIEMILIGVR